MVIKGLDDFTRKLAEVEKVAAELDGELASVNFNPHDPASIEQAIQQLNTSVDEKVSPYSSNDMVMNIAEQLKENGRAAILARAAEARSEEANHDDD